MINASANMPGAGSIPASVMADVRKAVDILTAVPGVTRIWLFGSAAGKRPMDARSDLDIAVEGLAPGKEFRLWSELDEQLFTPARSREMRGRFCFAALGNPKGNPTL